MTSNPIILFQDCYLVNAAETMVKEKVGFIPVIDRKTGNLFGIISEKEVMEELTLDSYSRFFYETTLDQIINKNPVSMDVNLNLFDAESIFRRYSFSHATVLDGQRAVGVIARRDLIKGALQLLACKEKSAQEIQKQREFKPSSLTDYYRMINSRL